MKTLTQIETIDIIAKEWFDKVNGNNYFSATLTTNYGKNSEKTYNLPFQYGYGDHYIDMVNQYMVENSIIKGERYSNGAYKPLWRYCKENNIILRTVKHKNCKKKEL